MKRETRLYLEDTLESINKITEYIENRTKEDFLENDLTQDAVVRRFLIIGEATRSLPQTIKEKYQNISWYKMIGMRNILVQVYSEADYDTIWDTIQKDLPRLKEQREEILSQPSL